MNGVENIQFGISKAKQFVNSAKTLVNFLLIRGGGVCPKIKKMR